MAGVEPVKARPDWLEVLHLRGRRGVVLAALCAALILPSPWHRLIPLLCYDRAGLAAGQWWRWLSGHVVHLDVDHAVLNATGLALLWTLFGGLLRGREWLLTILLSTAAVDLGLWYLQPQLHWYVGASGVLHGIMASGCVALLRSGDRAGWPATLLFAAKLAYEHWQGPLPFETQATVITAAHVYGAAGGVLATLPAAVQAAILRRRKLEVSH